jgi:hypothetical protein
MNIRTTSLTCAAVCLMTVATPLAALAQYAPPQPQYAPAQPPSYSPGQQPAYFSGQQPAYSPGQQPAYSPGQQPTEMVTNGPQTDQGDVSGNWSARRNVAESQHYDRLLETSAAFRRAREAKECGPVTDPQLHSDCLASFRQDEPFHGFRR